MLPNNTRHNQRGQALVESALSMSVYLAIIFATFNLAIVLFQFQSYSHRARNALRVALVDDYDASTTPAKIQNLVLFDQATVPAGSSDSDSGFMGLQRSNISVIPSITGSGDDRITVRISNYAFSTFAFAILGGTTGGTGATIEVSQPYEGSLP